MNLFRRQAKDATTPKYRIIDHPDWGFCAMVDTNHGNHNWIAGAEWAPIERDGTRGIGGEAFRDEFWRGKYWVATESDAGRRINLHATECGVGVVWEGG